PTHLCEPIGVHDKECTTAGANGGATPSAPPPPGCCTVEGHTKGSCMAATGLPPSARDNLPDDTCMGDNKCVPKSFVAGKPTSCDSGLLGRGVCLDECFSTKL